MYCRRCDMVITQSAAIMGLEEYDLEIGKHADLVVLDVGKPTVVIRLLKMARGKVFGQQERPRSSSIS